MKGGKCNIIFILETIHNELKKPLEKTDIFFGFNELTNTCQFYKNNGKKEFISYSYEIFKILIFPLEEVRKNINQLNEGNNPNMIVLYDCFSFNQKK